MIDEHLFAVGHDFELSSLSPSTPDFQPPMRTDGRDLLDSRNASVRLASVNWYGASDIHFVPGGLSVRHRDEIALMIRRMGFNSVRLPYSDEMVRLNSPLPADHITANPDLIGKRALDVYTAVISSLTAAGLFVIPNNHITQATWCCGVNLCDAGWANDWLGPICRVRQTEEDWIKNWETVMIPLANNSLVIGADLRNEVRGLWGTMRWETWAAAAERAGERLLAINPDWLMFIEGISSANDLSGVKNRRVALSRPARVVYSAHVYSWSGWGEFLPYSRRNYKSFAKAMRKNWAYLLEENVAPVWVGEMGVGNRPSKGDLHYWKHLIEFLADVEAQWGYWAINPRKPAKNEYESYALVKDDWKTVKWDFRMEDLTKLGLNASHQND
ncbi:glycoside hydrolase family 5 protein [Lepidopterella palustris CBS 459.81]|uniref:Glycoside hydrolase family 5 protein n=1 Tax=Lepidopterella palustris CBS 459.81 TaxID=1314670 RepID=A0A8E2E005_9PEZI|nr:glycoside hydrolase family 5 protein [Lepidopterella palustris CBS 459.81]